MAGPLGFGVTLQGETAMSIVGRPPALLAIAVCAAATGVVAQQQGSGYDEVVACPTPGPVEAGRTPEGLELDVSVDETVVRPSGSSGLAAYVTITLRNPLAEDVWLE